MSERSRGRQACGRRPQQSQAHLAPAGQVNYWSPSETGIKSRPIKPIKHPIEHINRKILLAYLLGFTFKLIAILTGPLVVLLVYLLSVPFVLCRRLTWRLLNLSWLADARIRTAEWSEEEEEGEQSQWNLCPLDYIEAYWFKQRLVNLVVLVLEGSEGERATQLAELRQLIRSNILRKPAFRKFLSRVEARGLPLYEGLYWRHLGLADEEQASSAAGTRERRASAANSQESASLGRFSPSEPSLCSQLEPRGQVHLAESAGKLDGPVQVSEHVLLDESLLVAGRSAKQLARDLLDGQLELRRPLWELRLVPDGRRASRAYLMFRCHQSLADGRSLAAILTDHLLARPVTSNGAISQQEEATTNEELRDNELRPMRPASSFVSRISRAEGFRSAIFVGPLTVLLWIIWAFSRRKNNHLNKCQPQQLAARRRLYMAHYDLTKFHQIKQITRSTASDVILCALSGALRDYLRKFNAVTNPPNLNVSLTVDMRQRGARPTANHHYEAEASSPSASPSASTNIDRSRTSASQVSQASRPQVNCTLVNVPLPTSVEGLVPRLWELRATMDELRTSADPWVMLGLQRFLFDCLPGACYRWLINRITLRNSSTFMSNIRGPQNLVESWCVDLTKRAVYEAMQPPRPMQPQSTTCQRAGQLSPSLRLAELRRQREQAARLKLVAGLGSLAAVYYCMQPPTSNIPISFNCITYNNKLFVSALSRSLLVEDSKLLLRLFFRQLDQLADTIAKRKTLFTIIRPPVPIEISCEPSDELADSSSLDEVIVVGGSGGEQAEDSQVINIDADEHADRDHDLQPGSPPDWQQGPLLQRKRRSSVGHPQHDLEANMGQADRCATCRQAACCCSRRKSLFSADTGRQHGMNLLSLLRPFMGKSRSRDNNQEPARLAGAAAECRQCGRRLVGELDEQEDGECEHLHAADSAPPSRASPAPSYANQAAHGAGLSCSACRLAAMRSTLSLDEHADWSSRDEPARVLALAADRSQAGHSSSQQLPLPTLEANSSKTLSKSETDLAPAANERRSDRKEPKVSWLAIGRHNYRKLSMFNARSLSPGPSRLGSGRLTDQQGAIKPSRSQNLFNPNRRDRRPAGNEASAIKRRQSVATSTGASHIQRSVIVKDETNADIQLRFHLDGHRARRPSTIGSVVGVQTRRASLIPFGLMHSTTTSFPKLFSNDNETHL